MASDKKSEFTSSLDRMLAETRRRFETLGGGTAPSRARAPSGRTATGATPTAPERPASASESTGAPFDPGASDAARLAKQRFGDRWAYEIVERRREGEVLVVRGRLTVADTNDRIGAEIARYGRARLGRVGLETPAGGSLDGIAFSFGAEPGPGGGANGESEEAALRAAADDALARCIAELPA
jgi:hypothetical protein